MGRAEGVTHGPERLIIDTVYDMILTYVQRLLILPPVFLAGGLVWFALNRPPADVQAVEEQPVAVKVANIGPVILNGSASGFGRVEPTRTWSGVAEVEGSLVEFADSLQPGAQVKAGRILYVIDPRDYEISVAQAKADVQRATADLRAIAVNAGNAAQSLEIEREILTIFEDDRNRIQTLVDGGSVAATQLDTANRSFYSQQSVVASLEATLALVDSDTLSAEAALAKAEADLERAERNLKRTTITVPFDARVTERRASEGQYVRPGDVLVSVEAIDASEITAAFQPVDLARLFGTLNTAEMFARTRDLPSETRLAQTLGAALRATVVARYGSDTEARWPAEITRITGNIDVETGTVGVVVRVEGAGMPDPVMQRPALVNGSFVEVILEGPALKDQIAVPRDAVRYEGTTPYVLVADDDSRLTRRDIALGAEIDGHFFITEGVSIGDRVVLSDPRPATIGLLLDPVESGVAR